jgi:hypothetical protein
MVCHDISKILLKMPFNTNQLINYGFQVKLDCSKIGAEGSSLDLL